MDEYGLECAVIYRCHMDYLDFIADKGLQERIISEKDKNKEKVKSLSLRSITCRFCVRDSCPPGSSEVSNGVVFYFSCFKEESSWPKGDCFFHRLPYGYGVGERNYQIGITAVRRSWKRFWIASRTMTSRTSTTTTTVPRRKTNRRRRRLTTSGFPSIPLFVPTHHLNLTIL